MADEEKKPISFRTPQRQRKQPHPRRLFHQPVHEIIPPLPVDYEGSLYDHPPWRYPFNNSSIHTLNHENEGRPTTPHPPPSNNVNQENQGKPTTCRPPPPSATPPSRNITTNNNNAIVNDQESEQPSSTPEPTSILISAKKVIKDWIQKLCKCCGPCRGSHGEEE